jgi:adenylosuccinate synthase
MGTVIVGGQWGDEGKGRIVDTLAAESDVIVRFQGGNNAGHSLHFENQSLVLHLIPCGIVRPQKIAVIGNGVVIDPNVLFDEIKSLKNSNIDVGAHNLKISDRAHVIFPYHKEQDALREKMASPIGTTKRGIGPCYEDKIARFGICTGDLVNPEFLKKKLKINHSLRKWFSEHEHEQIFAQAIILGEKLKPFLCDTGELLENYLKENKRVLFEGAQGSLLDVDHGTYPYVTSSNCVAAQASIGTGIGVKWLKEVLLVSKAYCTRVGEGPFLTELDESAQEKFRERGNEFGATTGRPRRCGWLDLPALKYACRINGATGLVITKIDILAGLGPIKVATSYHSAHEKNLNFPQALKLFNLGHAIIPDYLTLPKVDNFDEQLSAKKDLPESFQQLCNLIEEYCGVPIKMISFGKHRGQELWLR